MLHRVGDGHAQEAADVISQYIAISKSGDALGVVEPVFDGLLPILPVDHG